MPYLDDVLNPYQSLTGDLTPEDTLTGLLSEDGLLQGAIAISDVVGVTELSELTDVDITNPLNNDVLTYNDVTEKWENMPVQGGGGGTTDYDDLDNKPSINSVTLTGNLTTSDLGLFSGDYDDLTNKPTLATVATTGDYDDLIDKPTIPAAQVNSDWAAESGVAEILNKPSLATVATSGSYDDLTDQPTIPDITTTNISSDYTFTKSSGVWEIHSYYIYKTGNTYQAIFTLKGDGTAVSAGSDGCVYNMSTGAAPLLFSFFIAMVGTSLCLGFYNSGDSTWHFRPINAAVTLNANSRLNFSGIFIK